MNLEGLSRGEIVKYSQGNRAVLCRKNLPTDASRIGGKKKASIQQKAFLVFYRDTGTASYCSGRHFTEFRNILKTPTIFYSENLSFH